MASTGSGIDAALALVPGIVDDLLAADRGASLTVGFEAAEMSLAALEDCLDALDPAVLSARIDAVDAVRARLADFPDVLEADPAVREAERAAIVSAAERALSTALAQADGLLADPQAVDLATIAAVLDYALLARLQVAAELEGGPLAAEGLSDAVAAVEAVHDMAVAEIMEVAGEGIEPIIEILENPSVEDGLEVRDGLARIGAESTLLGISVTTSLGIDFIDWIAINSVDELWRNFERLTEVIDLTTLEVAEDVAARLGTGAIQAADAGLEAILLAGEALRGGDDDDALAGSEGDDALHGADGDDTLDGGAGDDQLTGGAGDDMLMGGAGYDVARVFGLVEEYAVSGNVAAATLSGPDGTDTLSRVETILFDDGELILEGISVEDAQVIAFLYGCAFDREPDLAGLNYWIDQFELGLDVMEIAKFMTREPGGEFEALYGPIQSLAIEDYVTQLYENTLDRVPEGDGFDFWVNALAEGLPRHEAVFFFSESEEYRANNDALISTLQEVGAGEWAFA